MRRGFKEEAKRLALDVRAELGLGPSEELDAEKLADLYGVRIYTIGSLSEFQCPAEAILHFSTIGEQSFSAALLPVGSCRIIIENGSHAPSRRQANLAHEMAHVVLEHEFTVSILTTDGCRAVAPEIEEEAHRLAGELLVPYQGALAAARAGWSDAQVGRHFNVSPKFAAMRMNGSGARKVATRQRHAYQRRQY